MTYAAQVDAILDAWDVRFPGFDSFTASEVAAEIGVPVSQGSTMMQLHRDAQKRGRTRWVAVCRGYARTAEWYILDGPGRTAGGAQRLSVAHAAHIAKDLRDRARSDLDAELDPAALGHPAINALMGGFAKQIEATVIGLVDSVNVTLDLIESTTGLVADRRGISTR